MDLSRSTHTKSLRSRLTRRGSAALVAAVAVFALIVPASSAQEAPYYYRAVDPTFSCNNSGTSMNIGFVGTVEWNYPAGSELWLYRSVDDNQFGWGTAYDMLEAEGETGSGGFSSAFGYPVDGAGPFIAVLEWRLSVPGQPETFIQGWVFQVEGIGDDTECSITILEAYEESADDGPDDPPSNGDGEGPGGDDGPGGNGPGGSGPGGSGPGGSGAGSGGPGAGGAATADPASAVSGQPRTVG